MHKGQITSIPQLTALTIARDERDGKLAGYASDEMKRHYPQLTAARRATLLYRARKMLKKEGEE